MEFNPHKNTDQTGKVIEVGQRVRDHDYKIGTVVDDRDVVGNGAESHCKMQGYCRGDHWFDIKRDDGTFAMMNGERLRVLHTRNLGVPQTFYDMMWHDDPEVSE